MSPKWGTEGSFGDISCIAFGTNIFFGFEAEHVIFYHKRLVNDIVPVDMKTSISILRN